MRKLDKARLIMNTLFIIAAAATLILYLVDSDGREYFYTGIAALSLKIFEYILRFVI